MPRQRKLARTEREFRCDLCGELFPNSDLVKVRVNTGSSRGRTYYNDRLACRPCSNQHSATGCITVIMSLMLLILFPYILVFAINSTNNRVNTPPQESLQRSK